MQDEKPKSTLAARFKRPLLATAAATAALAVPAPASADIFLWLDGLQGESQDAKFKSQIEILSYTQSFRNDGAGHSGGGGGQGKVQCGAVTVLKNIDRSSPELIHHVTAGTRFREGVLSFRNVQSRDTGVYYIVKLSEVFVVSIDQTDNPDPGKIVEKVVLSAAKYRFEYRPQKADGSFGASVTFGFDCEANKPF